MFLSLDESEAFFQHRHIPLQVINQVTLSPSLRSQLYPHLESYVLGSLLQLKLLGILELVKASCGNTKLNMVSELQLFATPVVVYDGHAPFAGIKLNDTMRGVAKRPRKGFSE